MVDADMKTNIFEVFAAGNCIAIKYLQITTTGAEGTIVAIAVKSCSFNTIN